MSSAVTKPRNGLLGTSSAPVGDHHGTTTPSATRRSVAHLVVDRAMRALSNQHAAGRRLVDQAATLAVEAHDIAIFGHQHGDPGQAVTSSATLACRGELAVRRWIRMNTADGPATAPA